MLTAEAQEIDRRPRSILRLRIAHKLTMASALMILLTILAGAVGLWQVFNIGQTTSEAREKEQQLAWSLELLAAGDRLVGALDRLVLTLDRKAMTQDLIFASTDTAVSLGALSFYVEILQGSGAETEASDLIGEIQVAYTELLQVVNQLDQLVRQELWTEAGTAMDQQVRPANEHLGLLIRQLVNQANSAVEATTQRAESETRQAVLRMIVLVVFTTGIALGWRRFVFRGLGLSITELRQGVARISSGDLEHKLDIKTGDEIEELGDEFNKMADELTDLIGTLEHRVAERTRGLQTAAEVSRTITSLLDPDELLRQVVNLVRERFDLYYVGLFVLDAGRQFAILQAGTGEAGRDMLAQGHRLKVGGESMIGQCVVTSEARIALDVGEEAVRFENPHLPETRSELALPMRSRGQIIGAMSVQSAEEAAFDETDIAIMQTVADQVAVALDNARLFAETQAALEETASTYRRYLAQAWTGYLQTAETTRYEITRPGAAPLGDGVLPEVQRAVEQHCTTVLHADGDGGESHSALIAPIALRGEIIGALGLHDDDAARHWSDDEIALVEAIAERMALAAENLRLRDETQLRAARERLISETTTRMRQSLDLDTVLQTAVREIGEALGLHDVTVQLSTDESSTA